MEQTRAQLKALERSYFPRFYVQGSAYARGSGAEIDGKRLCCLNGLAPNVQDYALGFTVTFPVMDLAPLRAKEQAQSAAIRAQTGVVLAFEPEVNNVVDSAQKARRLLDEIGSPYLKVTIDPANLFHAGELPRMREILDEAFALVGKDIVLAHAKDLDHDGDAGHLAAGQGRLDYDRYLSLLHTYRFRGPLLLHGLSVAQVPSCVAFLRQKLAGLPSHDKESWNRRMWGDGLRNHSGGS